MPTIAIFKATKPSKVERERVQRAAYDANRGDTLAVTVVPFNRRFWRVACDPDPKYLRIRTSTCVSIPGFPGKEYEIPDNCGYFQCLVPSERVDEFLEAFRVVLLPTLVKI